MTARAVDSKSPFYVLPMRRVIAHKALAESDLKHRTDARLQREKLRAVYGACCAMHDHEPLPMPKFAAELKHWD